MSQTFDLITSQGNRFILNKESLSYISKIKEEVVLVILLSSTDDNNLLGNIKLSLLSSILNNNKDNKCLLELFIFANKTLAPEFSFRKLLV